ncbi:MAG TPA: YdeI/OmpD-associated family protein [Bacteroidales bacterium]|nr:YdeI/OmpD-associated family protein [Bacteroidales bacterium]HPS16585.1 YdeI/OmpD-associated family protein [Bacteroidales bacterium]
MYNEIIPATFKTQKLWRTWLSKNHDKIDFIWLAIRKKDSKIKCITYREALDEALCFGWIDGMVKRYNDDYFIQRFTPRKPRSIWSQINKDKVTTLIESGKMTEAGIVKIEEAKKNGQWEKAYGIKVPQPLPDDLKKALKATPGAWKNFSAFAPCYQRMYIGWICFVKKDDARKRRIAKVVEYSLKNFKPGTL